MQSNENMKSAAVVFLVPQSEQRKQKTVNAVDIGKTIILVQMRNYIRLEKIILNI